MRYEYNKGDFVNTEHGITQVHAIAFGGYQVQGIRGLVWANKVKSVEIKFDLLDEFQFTNFNFGWEIKISDTLILRLIHSDGYYYPQLEELPGLADEEMQVVGLNKIKYVHQLQQLYFVLKQSELIRKIK